MCDALPAPRQDSDARLPAMTTVCAVQDEAARLVASEGQGSRARPETALAYLSQHCELAVVTLGDQGCIAQRQGDTDIVQEPACSGVTVIDATGDMALLLCVPA